MKFKDRNNETTTMVESVCLILSLGAIFIQIWTLMSGVESYFAGKHHLLIGSLILSAFCLGCCALTAMTTTLYPGSERRKSREKI